MAVVTLTVAAQENAFIRRGCRMGRIHPSEAASRHTSIVQGNRAEGVNPYIGNRHQLVVLAAFNDRAFEGDSVATLIKWNQIFNQENFNESPYVGSVHDYFYDQSYQQLNLTFDLQYVTLNASYTKYGSTASDDENSQFLVQDVMDSLMKRDIDWSLYDWSGDSYVNQLLILFAGKGNSMGGFGGGSDAIWPHQWWLSRHVNPETGKICEPVTVTYGDTSYQVDSYCAVQETGDTYASFGTICHEFSHCFGLPDFYGDYSYVLGWDLMDYGNYNGGGYCPVGYSSHERMLMGWLTPTVLSEATTVTQMEALSKKGEAYLIRNDAYEDEFYLVEHRRQDKWDAGLPTTGIVIFHVDYDETIWKTDVPNNILRPRYTIFPANNQSFKTCTSKNWYTKALWTYPYQDNDQLTNSSTPEAALNNANTDGTQLMNKSITDMAVNNGFASFTFTVNTTGIREMSSYRSAPDVYYNLAGQRISGPQKGVYILNGKKYINY